ncbi:anthranilate synthase component I family protein [Mesobacillus zeae]
MAKYAVQFKKIKYDAERFFDTYCMLSKNYKDHILLESGRGGQYSIAAFGPAAAITVKEGRLSINARGEDQNLDLGNGNKLQQIQEWLKRYEVDNVPGLPDFQGGAIGYISYDYARQIEKLPAETTDNLGLPDVQLFVFEECFVYDHEQNLLWVMVLHKAEEVNKAIEKAVFWKERWEGSGGPAADGAERAMERGAVPEDRLDVSMTERDFIDAVHKIQDYISAGDVFQVNLSVRQSRPITVPPIAVYRELRKFNPSPYMGFIHTSDFQIVSGSPELLIKKKGEWASTRPIAGTRSRGKDDAEDARLAAELIENEKEQAEHVMLVDLERNDLGRVCKYGTVEVDEYMVIEKYSHVMHIVSNVRGEIAEGQGWPEIIHATFPGGTITGAPKVRTMEIIEELEPVRRGIYTGSLGWIGFNGDMEMNIIIRTMLCKDGMAHVQAGAGIVIDSVAGNEYRESLKKGLALWNAKQLAEGKEGAAT